MKEFDQNPNERNNQPDPTKNENPTLDVRDDKNTSGQEEAPIVKKTEEAEQPAVPEKAGEPQSSQETPRQTPPQPQNNPYFRGYSSSGSYTSPYQQNHNHQGQNSGQSPRGEYRNDAGQQNQGQNWQNSYQPYQPPHQYGQQSGQISYTPVNRRKQAKPVTRSAIAVICCLTIILSGCFAFGGVYLANRMLAGENESGYTGNVNNPFGGAAQSGTKQEPVTIYREVEEVAVSTGNSDKNLTYAEVAALVKNSVVEITTEFNNNSVWYQYVTQGAGSGVIISDDGYIITNAHVITNEETAAVADNIIVRLTDGTEYTASVVGYDSDADIAILKVEAEGMTAAVCGDSDKLAVGEELVVVGNPLGELGGTVTNGIVSATEREISVNGVKMSLIQTNAAVNPGNSGGGMFNMAGQLVGIVNAKSSGSNVEGLGFAIPVNEALSVSEQLLEYGYVRGKVTIGVTFTEVSNSSFFFYYNLKPGVYVSELTPGYNDKVLQVGDRIIAVNEQEISSSHDIKEMLMGCAVGDTLKFQLYREGKLTEVEVTCYEKVPTPQSEIAFEEKEPGSQSDRSPR